MLLILLRHGTAEDGSPDKARELTKEGREEVAAVSQALSSYGIKPDILISSHRVRAIQSAEIISEKMKLMTKVERTDAVDYDQSWQALEEFLHERLKKEKEDVVVLSAGHQPNIGRLTHMALQGTAEDMSIKKGAAVGLQFKDEIEPGTAKLFFYLTPKLVM